MERNRAEKDRRILRGKERQEKTLEDDLTKKEVRLTVNRNKNKTRGMNKENEPGRLRRTMQK